MRRYDDLVEVRRGPVAGCADAPEQFLWRGRLWKVRAVVARWVETAPWWQSALVGAVVGDVSDDALTATGRAPRSGSVEPKEWRQFGSDLVAEREVWRVEAARPGPRDHVDPSMNDGVFDLSHDAVEGRWQLVGCQD